MSCTFNDCTEQKKKSSSYVLRVERKCSKCCGQHKLPVTARAWTGGSSTRHILHVWAKVIQLSYNQSTNEEE